MSRDVSFWRAFPDGVKANRELVSLSSLKMAISAEERKELKKKVSSQKSWFTRISSDTEKAAGRFGAKPNEEAAASVQTFLAKLDKMYLSLQESIAAYSEVCEDEAELTQLEAYADTTQDSYGKLKDGVDKVLNQYFEKVKEPRVHTSDLSGSSGYESQL